MDCTKMSAEDLRWRGRSDARTLAEGEAIKADPTRLKNAIAYADEIYNEQAKEMQGISKLVGKTAPKQIETYGKGKSFLSRVNPATVTRL